MEYNYTVFQGGKEKDWKKPSEIASVFFCFVLFSEGKIIYRALEGQRGGGGDGDELTFEIAIVGILQGVKIR